MTTLVQEVGGFRKRKADLRIALVYPNIYPVGMANLGLHTVYSLFNSYEKIACERFFLGMDKSMETNTPLGLFDVIAFSLQYEMDYTNVIKILKSCNIEPDRRRRNGPMVIAGGPCCFNPLPLTGIIDLFVVGEIEPLANDLVEGLLEGYGTDEMSSTPGLLSSQLLNLTKAARAMDLDSIPAPLNQPRPVSGVNPALGETFLVEISRGCNVRCRFCMYSHCTFPKRERSFQRIKEVVDKGLKITKSPKVSLIGALVTDHSEIKEILHYLSEIGVSVSLPSIRTDGVDDELMELIRALGVRTLTIAPEGSPKIRSTLKKGISEDSIRYVSEAAVDYGVEKLRMYFITGVPGETTQDLEYIANLSADLSRIYGRRRVTASVNPLVPKPHTPAEFLPMSKRGRLKSNYSFLRKFTPDSVNLNLQSIRESIIQAYLAKGTAITAKVLLSMDTGSTSYGEWKRAAEREGDSINRIFSPPDDTPWDIVDSGLNRSYLKRQHQSMLQN